MFKIILRKYWTLLQREQITRNRSDNTNILQTIILKIIKINLIYLHQTGNSLLWLLKSAHLQVRVWRRTNLRPEPRPRCCWTFVASVGHHRDKAAPEHVYVPSQHGPQADIFGLEVNLNFRYKCCNEVLHIQSYIKVNCSSQLFDILWLLIKIYIITSALILFDIFFFFSDYIFELCIKRIGRCLNLSLSNFPNAFTREFLLLNLYLRILYLYCALDIKFSFSVYKPHPNKKCVVLHYIVFKH